MSKTITFYSYKGGTGRSMALANLAWVMASNGKRVLVIDWDLEAPGLHRYFRPFLTDKELTGQESQGVIEMAMDFAVRAATPVTSGEGLGPDWYLEHADFSKWRKKLRWPSGGTVALGSNGRGGIDFVPAGRQDASYSDRVSLFSWHNFYEKLNGGAFLDAAKRNLSAYDYVLIDSRTGVSDTSGICTIHMPDTLVVCFTLNFQSIKGAVAVLDSVKKRRPEISAFPVPMRVDGNEEGLLRQMKNYASRVFTSFLDPGIDAGEYWYSMDVPYFPHYAYQEKLALFEERSSIATSILPATERLARYVTGGDVSGALPLPEDDRIESLAEFERVPFGSEKAEASPIRQVRQHPRVAPSESSPSFFISRAGEDREVAKWIAGVLEAEGHQTTLQDYDFTSGVFPEHIGRALGSAERFIAVLSPHYLEKQFTLAELHAAYARDPLHLIIPVHVATCKNPDLIKHLIYVDFVGKDEAHRKEALLHAISRTQIERRTSVQKLPTADPHLFGRDAQLEWIERAWSNPHTNFVQIIAPGGAGKTALMTRWYRRHVDDVTIFGWSFYSQGTREKSQTSSDPFFAEALRWFGITVPATESIFTKVELLVSRLRRERVLLILDGIEPLQDSEGGLRDLPLQSLLKDLAARNPGMVLATTRVRLGDVPDDEPHALSLDLENLDPADGARYLAHLGVLGPEDELRAASEAYENHALALTLLGTYLVTFCDGDIRRRADIKEIQVDDIKTGRHARKVTASYARMYEGQPELDILRALGYFDRPAEPEALKLVLPKMDDRKYRAALKRLRDARLVLTADPAKPLDCHPLVREHFAAEATREGHTRLYEHYTKQVPHQPDTLEEMAPLFYAVYHGCQAGRHQAAVSEVYRDRILRGGELYLTSKLGAFGTNLSLLANFFEPPWVQAVAALTPGDQSWAINEAGFTLRAVGRLADALGAVRASAELRVRSEDWRNAAISYGNLSQLHLALGNALEAVAAARQAVDFADRSGDAWERLSDRATLADTLHQSGDVAGAARLFAEAEHIQAGRQTTYPTLYSLAGYQYCDLLLGRGEAAEARRRASQTLAWAERHSALLSIGLDHLSLGRTHPPGSAEAAHHLDYAVDFLRRAGQLDHLPLGLLARGTPHDLDEAFRIATRSGMRLHLTDYHLIMARNALTAGDRPKAREHFQKAEALVQATGYHRRDPELAKLKADLAAQ